MSKDYFEKVLSNTITASEQWDKFATECGDVEAFKKAFHLRPTSRESEQITVVSTLESKPMRGVRKAKTKLAQFLQELYDEELHLTSEDDPSKEKKKDSLTKKGFKEKKKDSLTKKGFKEKEESYQAKMIKAMSGDSALKSFLEVESLTFIASEFIVDNDSKKLDKPDIIAYDGLGKVFFFELKTPENIKDKNLVQIKNYLHKYGIEKKDHTIAVLSNYPINSIKTSDVEFHGYLVYGYSANLDTTESKLFQSPDEPGVIYFR